MSIGFDTEERLSAIQAAARALAPFDTDWILDVGGHPGLLRNHLANPHVITCDMLTPGPLPYVRASAAELPFRDAAFRIALMSDTLEHTPADLRPKILRELFRVSSDAVIVAGPFNTIGVAEAEAAVREISESSGAGANRWLSEHADCGLPDIKSTWQIFASETKSAAIFPNGHLLQWLSFFLLDCIAQRAGAGAQDALANLARQLAQRNTGTVQGACYRQMVVGRKREALPAKLLELRHEEHPSAPTHADLESLNLKIKAATEFARIVANQIASAGTECPSHGPDSAYVEQLEKALGAQRDQLLEMQRQLAEKTPSSDGLLGSVRAMLRR